MGLGHDGRIQKLTVRTPPNNENEFALAKVGLEGFAYNSLVHVSSLKMIDFHAKMVHIFDAIYDFGFEHTWICYVDSKQNQRVGYEEPGHSPNDVNYLKQKSALNCDPLQQIRMPPNRLFVQNSTFKNTLFYIKIN